MPNYAARPTGIHVTPWLRPHPIAVTQHSWLRNHCSCYQAFTRNCILLCFVAFAFIWQFISKVQVVPQIWIRNIASSWTHVSFHSFWSRFTCTWAWRTWWLWWELSVPSKCICNHVYIGAESCIACGCTLQRIDELQSSLSFTKASWPIDSRLPRVTRAPPVPLDYSWSWHSPHSLWVRPPTVCADGALSQRLEPKGTERQKGCDAGWQRR